MVGRLTPVVALVAVATMLGGCKKGTPDTCKDTGCRYVYERRIEDAPPPPQTPDRIDHVMVLLSATGKTSHCAALFCKVKDGKATESVTISWMSAVPNPDKKGPLGRTTSYVVDGTNLDIAATMAWAKASGSVIERHGPYYVREDLYNRAKIQQEKLASGSVKYFSASTPSSRQTNATNGVHAISDILCNGDQFDKFLLTGNNRGRDASAILKVYFEKEGYIEARYRNETELLKEFDLQAVRRLD